jgi:pimeloyl-ACP methyl ester carboxylesterase
MMRALGLSRSHPRVWRMLRSAAVQCAAGSLALLAVGCQKQTTSGGQTTSDQQPSNAKEVTRGKQTTYKPTDPQWVKRHTPHAKVALVFVHGIFGKTLVTWTASSGTSFFQLIYDDPDVGEYVDVYAFGFTSKMFRSGSFEIQEAADKLQPYLEHDILHEGYQQVVFVGHSMGGLVILRYLLTHQKMLDRVPLVVFYATPQSGAEIAKVANLIANNPALADMIPGDKNESTLGVIRSGWKSIEGSRPHISCAYEKEKTSGILIVSATSANYFCDEAAAPIDGADHIHIVKPTRPNDEAVLVLVNALNKFAVGPQYAGKLETPEFKEEGDHSVFEIATIPSRHPATLRNTGFRPLHYDVKAVADPLIVTFKDRPVVLPNEPLTYVIRPQGTAVLEIRLARESMLTKPPYPFVLTSDVTRDRTVLVNVLDWSVVRAQWAKEARSVVTKLNRMLDNKQLARTESKSVARCNSEPYKAKDARESVVEAVRSAIAADNPDLSMDGQLLSTADFLNAVNWSPLAVLALQRLERVSPARIQSPSVATVSQIAAARSGVTRIFKSSEERAIFVATLAVKDQLLVTPELYDDSAMLAKQMQGVPSLRPYGLSLRGDLLWNRGDFLGAQAAYREAAEIQASPSISFRLRQVNEATSYNPLPYPRPATSQPARTPKKACPEAGKLLVHIEYGNKWKEEPSVDDLTELRMVHIENQGPYPRIPLGPLSLKGGRANQISVRHDPCSNTTIEINKACFVDLLCQSNGEPLKDVHVLISPTSECGDTPIDTDVPGMCGPMRPDAPPSIVVQ